MSNRYGRNKEKIDIVQTSPRQYALKLIILMGLTSLFADVTYEGARSITGPYLAYLGADAIIVSTVAGLGELIGYGLRLLSGYWADRTTRYWFFIIIGYVVNVLAVPLLALTYSWQMAATLIIVERIGKSIRTPARDAILSYASKDIGVGRGFGIHEALDKTGAMLGPLLVAGILYFKGSYREGFAVLLIPALFAIGALLISYLNYFSPLPSAHKTGMLKGKASPFSLRVYLAGAALIAVGYADFPLMAFHFVKESLVDQAMAPLFYMTAMGASAISALIFGYLYDRIGVPTLIIITLLSSFFAPFSFLGNAPMAIIGVILWGLGMGCHESVMKSLISDLTPSHKRGLFYGIFNIVYGSAWFVGSLILGILYEVSLIKLAIFSTVSQLLAIPFFIVALKGLKPEKP